MPCAPAVARHRAESVSSAGRNVAAVLVPPEVHVPAQQAQSFKAMDSTKPLVATAVDHPSCHDRAPGLARNLVDLPRVFQALVPDDRPPS